MINSKYFFQNPDLEIIEISENSKKEIINFAFSLDYRVADLTGKHFQSEKDLWEAIGDEMGFPSYFGKNSDATIECLGDLDWGHERTIMGAAVFVDSTDNLLENRSVIDRLSRVMGFAHEELYSPVDLTVGPPGRMLKLFIVQ